MDDMSQWYRQQNEWRAQPHVDAPFSTIQPWSMWDRAVALLVVGSLAFATLILAVLQTVVIFVAFMMIGG